MIIFFNELMAIIFISSIVPNEGKEKSINWEGQSTDFPRDLWITIQFRDKKRAVLYWISVHPLFHCHRPPVDSHAVAIQTHTRQSQTGNQTDLIGNQTNLSLKQHKYGIETGKMWNQNRQNDHIQKVEYTTIPPPEFLVILADFWAWELWLQSEISDFHCLSILGD